MALNGLKYEQSAVDIISPMLNITQRLDNQNKSNRDMLLEGTKGLAGGLAETAAMKKRSDMLDYKGDEYVKGLRSKVEELKAELMKVNHELEQLKKADEMTNDVPASNAEEVLSRYSSGQMNTYQPTIEELPASNPNLVNTYRQEKQLSDNLYNKYKVGSKALGGI